MATKITKDHLDRLFASVKGLMMARVLIGIPGDAPQRKPVKGVKTQPPNFVLGFIHEFGVPEKNIPARPFLIPGVRDAQPRVIKAAKAGAKNAMKLDADPSTDVVTATMTRMGQIAASAVQAKLRAGPFQPLAMATLAARARRGRKGAILEIKRRKAGQSPDNTNAKPLIDTAAMLQSVTFVIDRRK